MSIRLIVVLVLVACLSALVPAQSSGGIELPPDFESDGCTFFPDGNYRDCCVEHDKDYYKGGSCKERRRSDNRLYRCVKNKKGWKNKVIAPMMWLGVRALGVSFLPTPFRWGFGKKKTKKKKENGLKNDKQGDPQDEPKNPDKPDHLQPAEPAAPPAETEK